MFGAKIDGNNLILTIPLEKKPEPSKSGKSLVLATTGGNQSIGVKHNGKDVIMGMTVYIKNQG